MIECVIDAGVAVKWFFEEDDSERAVALQDFLVERNTAIHVPDFFDLEVGNVIWKKFRRDEISQRYVDRILTEFATLPRRRESSADLLQPAVNLACALGCTVYDGSYVALAVLRGCSVFTADQKLFRVVEKSPWEEQVVLLKHWAPPA